jgi:hypothetical protein
VMSRVIVNVGEGRYAVTVWLPPGPDHDLRARCAAIVGLCAAAGARTVPELLDVLGGAS